MKNLTDQEKKILKARNSGLSFCEINEDLVRSSIDQIMLRGAAIYGCSLPQTEFFASFIAEELTKLISDFGYAELTIDEILLSLNINCSSRAKFPSGLEIEEVVFSGTTFNVAFIAHVLENYMKIRNILDRKMQNIIDGYL